MIVDDTGNQDMIVDDQAIMCMTVKSLEIMVGNLKIMIMAVSKHGIMSLEIMIANDHDIMSQEIMIGIVGNHTKGIGTAEHKEVTIISLIVPRATTECRLRHF